MTDVLRFSTALRALLILFAVASGLAWGHASAADPTIVTAIRHTEEKKAFRLELDLAGTAAPQLVLLRKPYRVALDLDDTVSAVKLAAISGSEVVRDMRHGLVADNRYRIILTLTDAMRPDLEVARDETGSKVVLTLVPGRDADFSAPVALASKVAEPAAQPSAKPGKRFTVVVDPGHGGVDRGATGDGGTDEKSVNLAFGLALREALKSAPGVDVVLTRDDDTFIPLNERSAIARRAGANLFVSLHADSIRFKDLRGATVYTLSEKASDSLSREIAESENASDRFAGSEWDQDAPEIHDILVDLVRRETESFSEHFAVSLVAHLKDGGIQLINNPKRSAGFRVLRAPDVPSILVEIGYLSNAEEEKLLTSGDWQRKVAKVLAASIVEFARHRTGQPATLPR
ncbi:N-acetylmuramoyl-L-alanine amidase [Aureimonas sp. AU12]|uniref:N-acetylmuramoyl-L-alanine amidase n=1 Tax=Aureimonas sp. AU12 TaxID=1638161 RepID=UPI000782B9C8|nr:N-acetylmuramoyl-L-alanine amidase [Aureimonas sp. AU12]